MFYIADWLLVFRGTASNGVDMYDAWINGNNVVGYDVNCMRLDMTSCTHHYRNTIVDSWSAIPITRVTFHLFGIRKKSYNVRPVKLRFRYKDTQHYFTPFFQKGTCFS